MKILFEDQDILVLDKAAGEVVNRAESVKVETLQDWIEQYLEGDQLWLSARREDDEFRERSGMVHRLDKDTSGVIVFAKNPTAMRELMRQFHDREVEKTYVALVHGWLPKPHGIIRAAIERHPTRRERFTVSAEGRQSETEFRVKAEYLPLAAEKVKQAWEERSGGDGKKLEQQLAIYDGFSLVKLQPKTGRTHQIRVHMQFLKHPLVGDFRYTGRKRSRVDELWCHRQFLHAAKLTLTHPTSGERLTFESPLAPDLEKVLGLLTFRS